MRPDGLAVQELFPGRSVLRARSGFQVEGEDLGRLGPIGLPAEQLQRLSLPPVLRHRATARVCAEGLQHQFCHGRFIERAKPRAGHDKNT